MKVFRIILEFFKKLFSKRSDCCMELEAYPERETPDSILSATEEDLKAVEEGVLKSIK